MNPSWCVSQRHPYPSGRVALASGPEAHVEQQQRMPMSVASATDSSPHANAFLRREKQLLPWADVERG